MERRCRVALSSQLLSAFVGFRFPPEVIRLAVRWYLRLGLSFRDLEELLAERGIEVDHVTLHCCLSRRQQPRPTNPSQRPKQRQDPRHERFVLRGPRCCIDRVVLCRALCSGPSPP